MNGTNRATLWGETIVDELAAGGLEAVCIAPGSRSTPLTVAFAGHPEITVFSHLDERSAAYFALGRSRRTGEPTALVCTSGTAAANFHPAVVEADRGRVPLVVLTADRPRELADSGANQTIDQDDLYGDAVRRSVDLPDPAPTDRTVRSLRTTMARALSAATGAPAGPVHLNCRFAKPLEPDPDSTDVPEEVATELAAQSRDGPYVTTRVGTADADTETVETVGSALAAAERPLFVVGPADPAAVADRSGWQDALVDVAEGIGAPILADPLSTVRFGPQAESPTVCGGYDGYIDALPAPDCVVRLGASPTSKRLRHALRDAEPRQFLVDPAGDWREATFTATDLVGSDPASLLETLRNRLAGDGSHRDADGDWLDLFADAESVVDTVVADVCAPDRQRTAPIEGAVLADVLQRTPDPSTVFVSNSMPIRDADLFGQPRAAAITVLANRGASGIDGIVSSALGAGRADDEPLTLVTGDLALYHDSNGLLALSRCDVDATIVVVHNDGGGIFHKLPIEDHEPPFTAQFKTPHGLEFSALADLYDIEYQSVAPEEVGSAYDTAIETEGTDLLSVRFDAETSHRRREDVVETIRDRVSSASAGRG